MKRNEEKTHSRTQQGKRYTERMEFMCLTRREKKEREKEKRRRMCIPVFLALLFGNGHALPGGLVNVFFGFDVHLEGHGAK